jgi:hypothetical protein
VVLFLSRSFSAALPTRRFWQPSRRASRLPIPSLPRRGSQHGGFGFRRGGGWAHDYPVAEHHILDLTNRLTRINVEEESYVIVQLESEEIFEYPFLYFSEVGEMNLTPKETENFREYLGRGGIARSMTSIARIHWPGFRPDARCVRAISRRCRSTTHFRRAALTWTPNSLSAHQYGYPPRFYGY